MADFARLNKPAMRCDNLSTQETSVAASKAGKELQPLSPPTIAHAKPLMCTTYHMSPRLSVVQNGTPSKPHPHPHNSEYKYIPHNAHCNVQ